MSDQSFGGASAFVNTIFTPEAALLLDGEEGLGRIEYMTYPVRGDLVTLRTAPGGRVLTFVCTGRRFDFSKEAGPELTVVLGVRSSDGAPG